MLTSYQVALKNFSLNLDNDPVIGIGTTQPVIGIGTNQKSVSIGSSLECFDIHNFTDRMDIEPHQFSGISTIPSEKIGLAFGKLGIRSDGDIGTVGIGSTFKPFLEDNRSYAHLGHRNMIQWKDSVSKAMLIAILDGNGKRTTSIGSSTLTEKVNTFYNTLKRKNWKPEYVNTLGIYTARSEYSEYYYRNEAIKPWDTWYETHVSKEISQISRSNNVAIVTTTDAHGLDTSYDDWGAVITLNSSSTQSYSINVINNGSGAYTLSGNDRNGSVSGDNDTVNINVGDTITFNVNASGHPFWIKTSAITGTGYAVSGVINNGSQNLSLIHISEPTRPY